VNALTSGSVGVFEFLSRHSTDAIRAKVGVPHLDAPQTTQVFIALFLPLRDQRLVCDPLLKAVVVQLSRDGFPLVEEVIDIATPLVMDLKDRPQGLSLAFAFVCLRLRVPHLCLQFLECRLNQFPALGGRLTSGPSYFRHHYSVCCLQ